MKQYNRIMLGEHGKFLPDCVAHSFIGANFISDVDLSSYPSDDETQWRKQVIDLCLQKFPEKSIGTARTSAGFLWTVCHGLKQGDIVLASNGEGVYHVGKIVGDYYFASGEILPHRRKVEWINQTINRKDMSIELRNSSGSIGTCCNLTKYASEIESLLGEAPSSSTSLEAPSSINESYLERSLHRLLAHALLSEGILSKTIFHEKSSKTNPAKWVHPDMVGVRFNEFQDEITRTLLKAADTKEYLDIYSFELKKSITNDHELKQAFFQALSNSNWANFGYLVAFEISDDLNEETERLNRAFGIGLIRISPFDNSPQILFPARKHDVDYYTVDKLCKINPDFQNFMRRTAKVLTAGADVVEDVKKGLENICDKGFANDDELMNYCIDKHIPLSH